MLIALGVTGGIGAYKAVEVARGLQKRGHDVVAVMTAIGDAVRRRRSRSRRSRGAASSPISSTPGANADIEHIALASTIDLLLVAPATANIIGKFANGIADDFLSTLYLATRAPVLIAPAMNTQHVRARGRAAESARRWPPAACASSSPARAIWRAAGSARAGSPSPTRSSRRPSGCCGPTVRCAGSASW